MRRPRFTIASLLGIVLFLAVGLAALREASDPWDSGVFGVVLLVLLASVLLSIHRSAERRAYWLGFALFGSAYLAFSLAPSVSARLPTTKGLFYLDSKVANRSTSWTITLTTPTTTTLIGQPLNAATFSTTTTSNGITTAATNPVVNMQRWNAIAGTPTSGTQENFLQIGHSLLTLLMAFLGAHVSRFLHASSRPRPTEGSGAGLADATA